MHSFDAATRIGCVLFFGTLLSACAGGESDTGNVERIVRGDTVIVRTLGGGVWDSAATLVEEIRIGSIEGREEELFGMISEVAPDGQGGAYVFDGRAPALRHFDASGHFTGTFGGDGAGPGEYRDAALGLHVLKDGRVLLDDPRNARINVYAPDGTSVDNWPVASGLFTSNVMVVDTAGEMYLKILLSRPEPNKPWPIGLLHLDAQGQLVDTIPPPRIAGDPGAVEGVFGVVRVWEMSPLGYIVVGVNDRYSFELRKPDGSVVRIERASEPVALTDEEHGEWEARNEWTRRTQGQYMTAEIPPVPHVKPAYRGFDIGEDGQIWVRLYVPAEKVDLGAPPEPPPGTLPPPPLSWREPVVYDVFDPDGTYLGKVRMPARASLAAHRGTEVWATVRGELDEQYLVRYRLEIHSGP